MANTWDTLPPEVKQKLARHMMEGKEQSPDNMNRAMKILSQDPRKVDEEMKACYPDDTAHSLPDTQTDDGDQEGGDMQGDIEAEVERGLSQEGESDVQQTGRVANDIPPPEQGESMQAYIVRLAQMAQGETGGRRGMQKGYYPPGDEEDVG